MKGNNMSEYIKVRNIEHLYEMTGKNDEHDFRSSRDYRKSCELITINHTFGSLIRLKEYNKSLYKFWKFFEQDENKHIIKILSKQDKDFDFRDLVTLHSQLDQLTKAGLIDKKNVDDWIVFSSGNIGRKSQQDKDAN